MRRYLIHLLQLAANRPIATIAVTIILTLLLFMPLGWSTWSAYQDFNRIIVNEFRLQGLAGTIAHLDEVLTMSARMNAVTGDSKWERRYHQFEPQLDKAIKQAIRTAPEVYEGEGAAQTDAANIKLVELEKRSLDLVRRGQRSDAAQLLFSQEYEQQKQIYAAGIGRSTTVVQNRIQGSFDSFSQNLRLSSAVSLVSLLILVPIWWAVLKLLQHYLRDRNIAQQSLAAAKDQLEAVLNAVPGSISWIDSGGVYIGVNRHLAEHWNLSQDAFIGKEVGFLRGSTQFSDFLREFLASPNESASQVIEVGLNASRKYYLIASQKYQQSTATVSVGIDITERKQAEEALRQSEERFRSLVSNIPGAIYRCQYEPDLTMEFISDAIAEISGYPATEFIHNQTRTYASIIHPDDRDLVSVVIDHALIIQEPFNVEYRVLHQDGTLRWVVEQGRGIFDAQDNPSYLDGAIFDITERKQSEEALRQSEATNRALIAAIPDLLIRAKRDGTYLDIVGCDRLALQGVQHFLPGSNVYDSLPPDLAQLRMQHIQQALQTRELQVYEQRLLADNRPQDEEVRIVVTGEDEVLIMVRDITARKRAEDALKQLKDSFARFFPSEYLKFLNKDSVIHVQLGDHVSKEMVMMFSDIRSFTTLSESMTPQESFDFINSYLQRVSPEIHNHNGFIVKYLGDGVMAAFPDSVDDAVQAGIAQFHKIQEYNRERAAQGLMPLKIGMGIHIGQMMVGLIGEENRMQGDALSDIVNLTSRLEGLTKFYGVSLLISEDVVNRLSHPQQYQIHFLDRAIVKGRSEAIAVYEVLDAEVEAVRLLKLQTLPDFEQGLQKYSNGELTQAKACFEQVLTVNPLDKTAKLYLERVNQLMEEGVPENWDGVWAFSQK